MVSRTSDAGEQKEHFVERHDGHYVCRQGGLPTWSRAINIVTALDRLIADSQADGGPQIEFYDDVPVDELPSDVRAVVFSIIRELLFNACRHSKSKNVLVGIAQDEERVAIQVQDWGIGFEGETIQPHKRGLKGIQQAAQWLGGTVDIDTRPGAGTCIVVEIPLSRDNARSDHRQRTGERDVCHG